VLSRLDMCTDTCVAFCSFVPAGVSYAHLLLNHLHFSRPCGMQIPLSSYMCVNLSHRVNRFRLVLYQLQQGLNRFWRMRESGGARFPRGDKTASPRPTPDHIPVGRFSIFRREMHGLSRVRGSSFQVTSKLKLRLQASRKRKSAAL
jgi:hypothetical protein